MCRDQQQRHEFRQRTHKKGWLRAGYVIRFSQTDSGGLACRDQI